MPEITEKSLAQSLADALAGRPEDAAEFVAELCAQSAVTFEASNYPSDGEGITLTLEDGEVFTISIRQERGPRR